MRSRKWKTRDTYLLIFVVIFVMIMGIIFKCQENKGSESKDKGPEVPYTNTVEADQLVYFDAVSIVPESLISNKAYFGTADYSANQTVICRCETTEGKTVRIRMSTDTYKQNFDPAAQFTSVVFRDQTVRLDGKRIHGVFRKWKNSSGFWESAIYFKEVGPAS